MKYLFIIDWWMPFPKSEYGGVIVAIAESVEECASLLSDRYGNSHAIDLLKSVEEAQFFVLMNDRESGIVKEFYT